MEENLKNLTDVRIIEIGGQVFFRNCVDERLKDAVMRIGKEDPEFAAVLFNTVQNAYLQGMNHGAAMAAYGNDPEVKEKILRYTEYDRDAFETFWEMSKEYLKKI